MTGENDQIAAGQNSWFEKEMYDQWRQNPKSVPEQWQAKFAGVAESPTAPTATAPATASQPVAAAAPATALPATPALAAQEKETPAKKPASSTDTAAGEPIKGVPALIAKNMNESLTVPTATSFREVPAKLLELNRKVVNNHLSRIRGGKISFTHLIGYAIVRAIVEEVPGLSNSYVEDENGKPRLIRNEHVNLGIAVDQQKPDGSRSLIVPVIKNTETMSFAEFVAAYEALVKKVRGNKIAVDDLMGATVTLTNPGTIGTVQSVPRLMPGQGAIIGVGRIGYPAEFEATDPRTIAKLGISKIITVTSTYDHRIIQGAESGFFLKKVHELLVGKEEFYDKAFADLGVPYEAIKWNSDAARSSEDNRSATKRLNKELAVSNLINQYRSRGHLIATTNPLKETAEQMHTELDPATYGLTIWDLDREFLTGYENSVYAPISTDKTHMKLGDILGTLRDAYCRTIGIEYMHISDPVEKRWMQEQLEGSDVTTDPKQQQRILDRVCAAEALEKFLASRYVGQKRFGLEGAESAIAILDALLNEAAGDSLDKAIIGMAHRGRLNVLLNIMGKDPVKLFKEFEGAIDADAVQGGGDVKYHLGYEGIHTNPAGEQLEIELAANPSHLEAVDPVVVGMARAYMDQSDTGGYPILPILVHGDAAFAGQGVVPETLNLSQVKGYKVGGTVHLVINNQLGYTTAPHQSRSTDYSTDVAKAVQAPIFHVNADYPEACARVAKIAFDYRQKFNKDVVIDMIGYRRHGHNEGDDPSYTQPMMYSKIATRDSVRDMYAQSLDQRDEIASEKSDAVSKSYYDTLQAALDKARAEAPPAGLKAKPAPEPVGVLPPVDTAVDVEAINHIFDILNTTPEGFTVHPKLAKQFEARKKLFAEGQVDWALGEAFALGTIAAQGTPVRMAGQDSRRGTFAHRHATLHDYETGEEYTSLEAASPNGNFWIYDSTLSEYAALGYEYGYAVANPKALVLWEAQFGDFVNGAQIVIDQFLVASEDKWDQSVSLVMLLPHGYEGQGPEHSSGRLERFLLACAEDNIQIANVTTAAQFFHLLRRQIIQPDSRPLIVFTPKSGLRAKTSRSPLEKLVSGHFEETLDDTSATSPEAITRVIFASGKVGTEALTHKDENNLDFAAVVKVEQLYPWPFEGVADALAKYSNAKEIVWLQEEPENMGAWNAVKGRLYERHGNTHKIKRVSRRESGSPATGSAAIHRQEQAELLEKAFDKDIFN